LTAVQVPAVADAVVTAATVVVSMANTDKPMPATEKGLRIASPPGAGSAVRCVWRHSARNVSDPQETENPQNGHNSQDHPFGLSSFASYDGSNRECGLSLHRTRASGCPNQPSGRQRGRQRGRRGAGRSLRRGGRDEAGVECVGAGVGGVAEQWQAGPLLDRL